MKENKDIFKRTELLLGTETLNKVQTKRVIVFGIGGVGSWCAEALVRTGIEHITIVDFDDVCVTNVNRQLIATTKTVGQKKVEVLKQRLLDINPEVEVTAIQKIYSAENYESFELETYDYIIDAIDSLENKVHLIQAATKTNATFYSSMGAALKMDPTKIKVSEFWKVQGCPLGAALRRKMRKGDKPSKKFLCVYSDELLENKQVNIASEISGTSVDSSGLADNTLGKKGQPNGTLVFVTATFGLTLASLVIKDISTQQ